MKLLGFNKHFILYTFVFMGMLVHAQVFAESKPTKYCDSLINAGRRELDKRNHLKSLELTTQALQIARKNHWQDQLFSANNNIGSNYLALMDYGEAIHYYLTAYKIAIKEQWPNKEVMALNNIAVLYVKEKNLDKAEDYFKKAYNLSKKDNDSLHVAGYSLNLGLLNCDRNKLNEARRYFDEGLNYAKSDPNFVLIIKGAIAEVEMLKGNFKEARQLSLFLLNTIGKKEGNDTAVSLLLILAKSYLHDKNYTKAAAYAQDALALNKDLDTKKTIYSILADVYTQGKFFLEALRCKDSIFALQQKINEAKNGRLFENTRVKFEMQEYQNQIALNEATIANDREMFYSILLGLTAVLLLIFFILRNLAIKQKQKKLVAETHSKTLALELERKKTEALLQEKNYREQHIKTQLEQERLKNEIEYKNRKLSSKALHMSGKDLLIEEFVGLLSGQPEVAKIPAVRNHIRHLQNTLKTDNEWESFLKHFEEVNHGFLSRLKARHKDLTANDIRFICYVYMNLSAKEMASMLNISLDACRKRKERVALKLGLADATSLYGYLSGI